MLYRNLLYLIILLFIAACDENNTSISGNSKELQKHDTVTAPVSITNVDTVPRDIAGIQKAYEVTLEQLKNGVFDSTSFKYSCDNEKNGTVIYFFEKEVLRMIVHRYNEYSHHSAEDYYFVKDSILFFSYFERVSWSFDGPEGSTKDNITEQRVYLVEQKPIRCLEKKFVVGSQETNNPRSETVANKEVPCASFKSVINPFLVLLKHRYNPTTTCLDN